MACLPTGRFDDFSIMSTGSPVIQETHYDPWGLELTGIGFQASGMKVNKYLYNGKELLDDLNLNLYDHGARLFDPTIGRWISVDPMAHLREWVSPYNFVQNNPLNRIDPDGAFDWVVNRETNEYTWMDNVTSASDTPEGYSYVGAKDSDILRDLGVAFKLPGQESNRVGYVAMDVEQGRYAANHLINVKAKSNVTISADVRYNMSEGSENNVLGRKFEGVKISAIVVGSNSGTDGRVDAHSGLSVDYGGQSYTTALRNPQGSYAKQTGTQIGVGSVTIPASQTSQSKSFTGVSVSGGWWATNSANMRTPVVYHPLTPYPHSFKHSWTFPNK